MIFNYLYSLRHRLTPLLIKQIRRFLITGFIALFVDIIVYVVLLNMLGVFYAKTVSFISATIVTYLLNKHWTFDQKYFSIKETIVFILFYIISANINGALNTFGVFLFQSKVLAFIIANSVCMVTNFFGLKMIVFRSRT